MSVVVRILESVEAVSAAQRPFNIEGAEDPTEDGIKTILSITLLWTKCSRKHLAKNKMVEWSRAIFLSIFLRRILNLIRF